MERQEQTLTFSTPRGEPGLYTNPVLASFEVLREQGGLAVGDATKGADTTRTTPLPCL